MKYDKAYVISLKEHQKRANRFLKYANRAGVEVSLFEALKGTEIDTDKLKTEGLLSDDFFLHMAGSLGTLMSHTSIWRDVRDNPDCNIGLIFEDDALINKKFESKLSSIPLDDIPDDWDMIWLGWHKINGDKYNNSFTTPIKGKKGNSGHYAYLIKSSSVDKLLDIVFPYNNRNSKDVILRKNFDKFNAYFLTKRIVRTPYIQFGSTRKLINNSI